MSEKHWRDRLHDMLERISHIEASLNGVDYEDFIKDQDKIDALERNLEIIGEASQYLPDTIKQNYSDMPWDKLYGMRNILVHGYDIIMADILWFTVQKQIPELKETLLDIRDKY